MKKIQYIFKTHPTVNELHQTSDGMVFIKDHDAFNHSKDLKDTKIKPISRAEAFSVEEKAEDNLPEGEPNKDWTNSQLEQYCELVNIEYKKGSNKDTLLSAIEAATE